MKKLLLISLILFGIFTSLFVYAEVTTITCENHLNYRECSNGFGENKSLEIFDKFFNGTDYLQYNTNFMSINEKGYNYKTISAPYTFYAKSNSNFGDGVKYCVTDKGQEYCLTYQAQDMGYRNKVGGQDYLSSIQNANAVLNLNHITYEGVFTNVDLEYKTDKNLIKENFILNSLPRVPQSYLGENITLDFGGYLKFGNLDVYANGQIQTGNSFVTDDEIHFQNKGESIFYLPKPVAIDGAGNSVDLEYEVKIQGQQIWFYTRTPYNWLSDPSRVFPVEIDPSLEITSGTTNLGGNLTYDHVIVHSGATLGINATGYLNITATDYIYVYGTVSGDGVGTSTTGNGGTGGNSQVGIGHGSGEGGGK